MSERALLLAAAPPDLPVRGPSELELLLGILLLVALLTVVAGRIGVPYPILMTLGGLLLGLVPNLPRLELAPDLVFVLILLVAAGVVVVVVKANQRQALARSFMTLPWEIQLKSPSCFVRL